MPDYVDAVVVGAGLMGAASAWSLARRGYSVLVLEQFDAGHAHGSSHGSARIVRRAYADPLYAELTGRAFELWRELETTTDTTVLRMLGGIDFGPSRAPAVAAQLAERGVPHEVLPAAEAQTRWPGMRFDGNVVFHPQAGTLDSALAVDSFVSAAGASGASVRFAAGVESVVPDSDGVLVRLVDGTTVRARHAVLAAGAWLAPLLGELVRLPALEVTEQHVFHFPRVDPSRPPWPSVIHAATREVYHLAGGRDGGPEDDRKIGEHDRGVPTSAAGRPATVDAATRSRLVEYVRRWLPGLDPVPRSETTCLYTITPSEDFVLDRVGPLIVCSPCSGHGAKFAPLIGEFVADLVAGTADVPARFRLAAHAAGRAGSVSL